MYAELTRLLDEVRTTFHAATNLAQRLHGNDIDPPGRAVLEFLVRQGPAPVPEIARARGVSRQHIQAIANSLLEQGLVRTDPNPAHQRSSLLALTPAGDALIRTAFEREARFATTLEPMLDADELLRAAGVLSHLRTHLDQGEDHR